MLYPGEIFLYIYLSYTLIKSTGLLIVKVKVKQCLYWPLGVQEVQTPRISKYLVPESGQFVCRTYRPPLPPGDTRGTHFFGEGVDSSAIERPDELSQ